MIPAQISMFDLFKCYCQSNHTGETLLLVENFEVDMGEEIPDLNGLIVVSQHFSEFKPEPITIMTSVVMIYKIAEDSVGAILSRAHNEKWGWGDSVYVWEKDKLLWGRD